MTRLTDFHVQQNVTTMLTTKSRDQNVISRNNCQCLAISLNKIIMWINIIMFYCVLNSFIIYTMKFKIMLWITRVAHNSKSTSGLYNWIMKYLSAFLVLNVQTYSKKLFISPANNYTGVLRKRISSSLS